MEREEEEEMLREKRSLQCWREAQSPAHPGGGPPLWIRRLWHGGGCGIHRVPMDHTSPAAADARVGYPGVPKLWKPRGPSVDGVTLPRV